MKCASCGSENTKVCVNVMMMVDTKEGLLTKDVIRKKSTEIISADWETASFMCPDCGCVWGKGWNRADVKQCVKDGKITYPGVKEFSRSVIIKDIVAMQEKYRLLKIDGELTKENICRVCKPFNEKYGLQEFEVLGIARGEYSSKEMLAMIGGKRESSPKAETEYDEVYPQ